jgi:acetyl-CoA carboxylase carboxyl transferase subunit alpha
MSTFLEFEKPIGELEGKIKELRHLSDGDGINIVDEVTKLQEKLDRLLVHTYGNLSPWQKTLVARHPDRPHCMDYVAALFDDFTILAGDRLFADDKAVIGGMARFKGRSIMVIGLEKGRDTEGRIAHNFGMARPEGYRKAVRLMRLADRFGLPVVTLVDTPGAYPGVGAEERGQAEAIARSIETCLELRVPVISAVIGEGGSGGAIALAVANVVLILEHAIYSVISPEGCASILWRDAGQAEEAATALKLTAQDLDSMGLVDGVVPEPVGGAHRDPEKSISALGDALSEAFATLDAIAPDEIRRHRRDAFLAKAGSLDDIAAPT